MRASFAELEVRQVICFWRCKKRVHCVLLCHCQDDGGCVCRKRRRNRTFNRKNVSLVRVIEIREKVRVCLVQHLVLSFYGGANIHASFCLRFNPQKLYYTANIYSLVWGTVDQRNNFSASTNLLTFGQFIQNLVSCWMKVKVHLENP